MRLKADLTLLLISIIWGSAFVSQRVAGQMGSVYLFNSVRFLLGALVALPFAMQAARTRSGGGRQGIDRSQWLWMGVAGAVLFGAAAFQQAGLLSTTAGNAGFITSLYVVFVPVALLLFWREKPHWLAVVAVVLAAAGAFLLSSGGKSLSLQPGDTLELIGAGLWTFHVLLLGKFAARFEPLSFSVGQLVLSGLLNLAVSFAAEAPDLHKVLALAGPIIYTGVLSVGAGYTLQVWAQRHTPPADAALILSLESVFAAVTGWIILSETLTPVQITGCALILAAVVSAQAKPRVSV